MIARDDLGAHMSIAGGLALALERGQATGCSTVQIFLRNQRQWAARPLGEDEVRAFRAARRGTGIHPVFAHASYLINLAAPDDLRWRQAIDAFTDELERAERLGLAFVVIHPGSHAGRGAEAGMRRIVAALDEVTRRTAGCRVRIALENSAGAGRTIGRSLAELGWLIREAATPARLGVCIDTCHLFTAGHDIRTPEGWEGVVAACRAHVGLRRVLAFHLNDARAPLGSGLDRHQHIGQGHLGRAAFRRLLTDPRFRRVPKVLETPKDPEPRADLRNLAVLRALRRAPPRGGRPRPGPRDQARGGDAGPGGTGRPLPGVPAADVGASRARSARMRSAAASAGS
jgi:deoxyribonuclease-4